RPSRPIVDDVAADNGINAGVAGGDLTITGTTTAGTDVFVSFAGVVVDRQATSGVGGTTWCEEVSEAELATLVDGTPYHVTAYATDRTNQSTVGASEAITFDRVAPAAPPITAVDDLINAAGATISGTAELGSTVHVSLGGVAHAPISVDANGN